jgi:hypothetical protein
MATRLSNRSPIFLLVALLALMPSILLAASRTFVSAVVGSDSNACTVTAPCRSIATALAVTDSRGEVVILDSGGYGSVTIDRSVTIANPSGIHAALTSTSATAITVAAGASDIVVLRNLFVNGLGTGYRGIDFVSGRTLYVDACLIEGFTNSAVDGSPANSDLHVTDSVARDNAYGFIYGTLSGVARGTFIRDRAEHTGYGFAPSANSIGTVIDCVAAGNTYGFYSGATGSSVLNVDRSVAVGNSYGVYTFNIARVKNSLIGVLPKN